LAFARPSLFFVAGDQIFFDDKFAPDTTARAPGSCNWMLGGGRNFDHNWGITTDINVDCGVFRKIGEMSDFTVLPTARFRWQFLYREVNTSLQQRSSSGALVGQATKSSWNYTGMAPSLRLTAHLP